MLENKIKPSDNLIYELEGTIKVYNYPTNYGRTHSYVTLTYQEFNRDKLGHVLVESKPIYFYELTPELEALAKCIGEAQYILSQKLHGKFLKSNSIY